MINETSKQTYTTVGELIEELKRFDKDQLVVVRVSNRTISHPLFTVSQGETERRRAALIEIRDGEYANHNEGADE